MAHHAEPHREVPGTWEADGGKEMEARTLLWFPWEDPGRGGSIGSRDLGQAAVVLGVDVL